jgi:hypothetical protein
VALVLIPASPASARVGAAGTGAASVSSTTWGVAATSTINGTPTAGTVISMSYSLLSGGPQYFDVVNIKSATLVATTYQVGISVSGIPLLNVSSTLSSCTSTWTQSNGTCSSGASTIGTFSGSSSSLDSTVAPLSPNSRLHLKASVSGLTVGSMTVTVQELVSSGGPRDIAAKKTTNG